eukprot:1354427-Rhodomonas_salina.1
MVACRPSLVTSLVVSIFVVQVVHAFFSPHATALIGGRGVSHRRATALPAAQKRISWLNPSRTGTRTKLHDFLSMQSQKGDDNPEVKSLDLLSLLPCQRAAAPPHHINVDEM